MKLMDLSFENFADKVKTEQYKIVVFGAGTIGKTLIPFVCQKYGLDDYVVAYVDNDRKKDSQEVELSTKNVEIHSIDFFDCYCGEKFLIIVTNGDFFSVINQLNSIKSLDEVCCYIAPVMQLSHGKKSHFQIKTNSNQRIPKVIHYCWFSGRPIPNVLKKCIDSWKIFCPDYEILEWNEKNFDVKKYKFTYDAYKNKKWAHIVDVARFDILYNYGGIYLDTDVEMIKSFDDLLCQNAFCGREAWGHVNTGGGAGCVPNFTPIKELLDYRLKNDQIINSNGTILTNSSGYYETKPLLSYGLEVEDKTQVVNGITVYSSDYFHPYNYGTGIINITDNTHSIHRFNGGWLDDNSALQRDETRKNYDRVLEMLQEG